MKILKKSIAQSLALLTLLGGISLPARAVREKEFLEAVRQRKTNDVLASLESKTLNVNYEDENGNTALTLAIQNNCFRIIGILLGQGMDPTIPLKNGSTPLNIAAESETSEVVSYILARYKITDQDVICETLHRASKNENPDVLRTLIDEYKSRNIDAIKYTFTKAVKEGYTDFAKSLLEQEAISIIDAYKMATDKAETTATITSFLLDYGVNPTQPVCNGEGKGKRSLLGMATVSKHLPSISAILSRCDSISEDTIRNSLHSVCENMLLTERNDVLERLISGYRSKNQDALNKLFVDSSTKDKYNYVLAIHLLKFGGISDKQSLDQ